MKYKEIEIKKGIKLHIINNDKFKTNLIAIFLTLPITKENVTKNSLIASILRRGSKNMQTSTEISKQLEEMYGASFNCGIDKTGDNHIIKFYMESVNDNFLPQKNENMLKTSIEKLLEITFNPVLENGKFKEEYLIQEKENLRRIIQGKTDDKANYAFERCIEEMYKNEPYGLYKYGYIEDLDIIDSKSLYEYYENIKKQCKIDIFISGNIEDNIENILIDNENICKLEDREPNYVISKLQIKDKQKENEIKEEMDVIQGKIVIGLDLNIKNVEQKYAATIYNAILGGTANSKLFQEVREKASLAYTAGSSYLKHKNNIFIKCGIEIKNYEKTLNIIRKQLDDMEKGEFTEEDINNAKKGIISTIKSIDDEQDTEITYLFGQELSNDKISFEEYTKKIKNVKKEDIIEIAKSIKINTIYFLKNNDTIEEGK